VLPSARATARVRIFTPTFEMPFAGHPTLGSAHVVRELRGTGDRVTLEMIAGVIPVEGDGAVWTLEANPPKHRPPEATRADLAAMLGLAETDLGPTPMWVDTGSDQLVIPIVGFDAVRRAMPHRDLMLAHARNATRAMAYLFARQGEQVLARFFFLKHMAVVEDPGTGSACANLGGWWLATGAPLPCRLTVDQGEAVGRPCRLNLEVTSDRAIRVSGQVIELGRGIVRL
jgi:PhzF family phenazine biosynthesis protein